MIYDAAVWHYGGDFPADLPRAAGATHMGMFLAWMLLNGHGADRHTPALAPQHARAITPGAWFMANCAEQLTDADLSAEGNRFAQAYYLFDEDRLDEGEPSFMPDYAKSFPDADFAYSLPDDWATYDMLAPILAHRFAPWRGMNSFTGGDNGLCNPDRGTEGRSDCRHAEPPAGAERAQQPGAAGPVEGVRRL